MATAKSIVINGQTIQLSSEDVDRMKSFLFKDEIPYIKIDYVHAEDGTPLADVLEALSNGGGAGEGGSEAGQGGNPSGFIKDPETGGIHTDVTSATGMGAFAVGNGTVAQGENSVAEGWQTHATGYNSHAEGTMTTASGENSHAEGESTTASERKSHAEGDGTTASGENSHAEGRSTTASGYNSHAEGAESVAEGTASHVDGFFTQAFNYGEHACGQYNKSHQSDTPDKSTIFSVGVGESEYDRKNAIAVTPSGKVYIIGIGGYDGTNLETAKSVQAAFAEL